MFTGIAVTEYVDAARVGRQVTPNLTRPFRTQTERKMPIRFCGGLLDVCQNTARLNGHGVVDWIDVEDPVEPPEVDQDVVSA